MSLIREKTVVTPPTQVCFDIIQRCSSQAPVARSGTGLHAAAMFFVTTGNHVGNVLWLILASRLPTKIQFLFMWFLSC